MDTPLSKISDLIPLIEKIAADKATEIVNATLNKAQYSVPTVPDHHHNGTDSSQLDVNNLTNAQLPAFGDGVVSPKNLTGFQVISTKILAPGMIIRDAGGTFNGGDAPEGTIMIYTNSANLSQQLYIRVDVDGYTDRWWGCDLNLTAS